MKTLSYWIGAAAAAFILALAPTAGHAQSTGNEGFCTVVADAAQSAANARNQGLLLGQYKGMIARRATRDNADMIALVNKVGTIVYTSEDFAGLAPEQAMRYAYRTCMSIKN